MMKEDSWRNLTPQQLRNSQSPLCHKDVGWMRWRNAFLHGDFKPKQHLSCLSVCHGVISHTRSHGSSISLHRHLFGFSYNPSLNYRNGYHAVSNNNSHAYCLSIVRRAPSLASARTHNHHTQRTLPARLPEPSGQRSPVASGLHDNSMAVPNTQPVSPPHPPPTIHPLTHTHIHTHSGSLTHRNSFCPQTPVHQKRPWSVSFSPNIYSSTGQTLFNTLQCRRPPELQSDRK